MNLNDLSTYDIAADIRLLVDTEAVDHVAFAAEVSGRDRVIVTVAVEGGSGSRRCGLHVRELD